MIKLIITFSYKIVILIVYFILMMSRLILIKVQVSYNSIKNIKNIN